MSYILNPSNWSSSDSFYPSIPSQFALHLLITVLTLAIGLAIAFPVSLLLVRYTRLYVPVITGAGIIYTIPSLALIPLLVPVTGLTTLTVLIPLIAYTQVVLISNIVAALRSVDPALVEVGRAMGMDRWQLQLRVILPLALPVIVAGIRVAAVTTIGIATFGPWVGVYDLGYPIFQGFNLHRDGWIAGGAILVSAFAILVDLLLLALERALGRGRAAAAATAVAA